MRSIQFFSRIGSLRVLTLVVAVVAVVAWLPGAARVQSAVDGFKPGAPGANDEVRALADVPVRVGPEFLVNASNTFSDQWHPSVAPLPNGGAVVVWAGPDEVRGQRLDANGLPIGTAFRVGDADDLEPVTVATSPTGAFVVAWQNSLSIRARRYDSSGNPLGGAFQVNNTGLNATHDQVAVAMLPDGFVVAWHSRGDSSGYGIVGRRYDANGAAVGSDFRMNTTTVGNQARPSAVPRASGGFTVVWESDGQDGSGFGIIGQHYDTNANRVGPEFQVNTQVAGHQARPRAASNPNGEMVVVWQSEGQDGNDWGVYGQRYDAAGNRVGGEFRVNTTTAGIQQRPAVAFDATGDFMVAWENYYQPGELAGNMKDVFAQRYDGNGAPVGSEVRVNTHIADFQDWAAVTGAANAEFLVVWNSNAQDGSGYGVYAQRFGSATEPLPSPTPIPDGAILIEQVRHSLRHTTQFNCGICTYCDCPSTCDWRGHGSPGQESRDEEESSSLEDPYLRFPFPAMTQSWGADAIRSRSHRAQSGAGTTTLPVQAVSPGEPFPLLHFTHMNVPIRGSAPEDLRITAAVVLRPVGEPAFEVPICSIPLQFLETDNAPPCDPSIQRSGVACDDRFQIIGQPSAEITANGRIWKVQILGFRDPSSGAIIPTFITQEVMETVTEIVAVVTVQSGETPTPTPTPAPILVTSGVTRQQGSPSLNSQIATTPDTEIPENLLRVQISNGGSFGDAASLNGVIVTLTDQNADAPNINPNLAGQILADVVATCTATNATFTLRLMDTNGLTKDAPFTVTVNPNTPPVLSYGAQSVAVGATPTFAPASGPADNGAVSTITLQVITPASGLTLSVDNATGKVTVTGASLIGSYTAVIRATDNCSPGAGSFTDATITIMVTCPTISPSPASLPNATVNTAYPRTISAAPAGTAYSFAVTSGSLPAGLTLNSNGSFSGAPAQSGNFNFRITASGSGACSGFRDYVLVVDCPGLTLNPSTLPGGTVGAAYNQTVSASPNGSYNYSVTSGALPPGLMLNAATSGGSGGGGDGAITGTPSQAGNFTFTITASAGSCIGSRSYTVTIGCSGITLGALGGATAGASYAGSVAASPAGSYTYSLVAGSLPGGLALHPSTGAVTGSPTVTGTFNFTVKAQTANGCSATQTYSLMVACPAITLSDLAKPGLNTSFHQAVTASPSGGTYSFAVTAGALPAGLSLNAATGVISGTPTAAGAYSFTITAFGSGGFGGCAGSRAYSGTIGGGCQTIMLADLPNGAPGQLYSNAVNAAPGGAYSYAVTSGSLPPGLTLYASMGLIYGYPATAGSYSFTISATDANHCTGSRQYNLLIGSAVSQ